ncbi:MAG: formimidoylglutamate deiminase [Proteobacteria bacterium]|nr:formimidoylglutamate deiminase [Pseudomonadota bacterium]
MTVIHAAQALTPLGWNSDVRVVIEAGRIVSVTANTPAREGDEQHAILLPAMSNLHSHAFQRAMAGLTELRGPSEDNFWSWRDLMYRFALEISPEQVEAVAAQLYVEMLEAGFCRVGEFHYLHHDRDGKPYSNVAEMATRVAAAAAETGIGLTLLPVFYAHASFGGLAPRDDQRRFINDVRGYNRLLEGCRAAVKPLGTGIVGVAPHSLRAVTPDELKDVAGMAGDAPIHIHIAEQTGEVDACIAWSGRRPVEWLLDHNDVDEQWCLVHATHMTDDETIRMARSGATAGLAPITEANLGDGVFNAKVFVAHGGRYGIGSDSNVQIGITDELRMLEYSQRLFNRARNVMAAERHSTGRALYQSAVIGGALSVGAHPGGLSAGAPADVFTLRREQTALAARKGDDVLDTWIFTGGDSPVDCVWVAGKKVVAGGRHRRRDEIAGKFAVAMRELSAL